MNGRPPRPASTGRDRGTWVRCAGGVFDAFTLTVGGGGAGGAALVVSGAASTGFEAIGGGVTLVDGLGVVALPSPRTAKPTRSPALTQIDPTTKRAISEIDRAFSADSALRTDACGGGMETEALARPALDGGTGGGTESAPPARPALEGGAGGGTASEALVRPALAGATVIGAFARPALEGEATGGAGIACVVPEGGSGGRGPVIVGGIGGSGPVIAGGGTGRNGPVWSAACGGGGVITGLAVFGGAVFAIGTSSRGTVLFGRDA